MKYATTRVGEPSQMRLTFECRNSVPQLDLYFLRWHKCSVCHIELERLSNYIRKVYFVVLARCVPSDSGNQARRQKKALGSSPILSAFTMSLAPRVCCFLLFSDPRVRKTRNEVKGKERSLEWSRYKFNFPAQICANTNPHALCCLKQDWSKLYSLREIFFKLFSYYPPPGLASFFPVDRNFSKGASFSNIFSRSWLLKNCVSIFLTRLLDRPGPLNEASSCPGIARCESQGRGSP